MSASMSISSFHDDAPKDYRQVSLTAVKQRFEDKCYEEISQEEVCPRFVPWAPGGDAWTALQFFTLASLQVLSYAELCSALGVKQESPDPPSFPSTGEIHTFLSSPSGRRSKR